MKPGSVFYYKDFKFKDGGEANKLFVLMTHARNGQFLVVKTTSVLKPWRQRNEGCSAKAGYYYFPAKKETWFDLGTWIVLSDPLLLDATQLLARFREQRVVVQTTLAVQYFAAIKNCLKQVEDISAEMLAMLK